MSFVKSYYLVQISITLIHIISNKMIEYTYLLEIRQMYQSCRYVLRSSLFAEKARMSGYQGTECSHDLISCCQSQFMAIKCFKNTRMGICVNKYSCKSFHVIVYHWQENYTLFLTANMTEHSLIMIHCYYLSMRVIFVRYSLIV